MYIAPQIYRNWIPISTINSIDKSKPFVFNIGTLPLILWFHSNINNPSVIINSCKHLASPLNKATINNNCLICPNHNFSYNNSHNFGSTFVNYQDGLIWWAFKPNSKNPFILNHNNHNNYNNQNYQNSYFNSNYIIKSDIITFILNFIHHFSINNNNYKFNHGKLFIKNPDSNQRLLFIYPYTFIIKDDNLSSIIKISIRPIPNSKLKIFISTNSSYLSYNIIKIINNIASYHNNFKFKYNLLLTNNYNPILDKIYNYYKNNYMDLNNDLTISNFILNYKFF
jgi:hypothetical protein